MWQGPGPVGVGRLTPMASPDSLPSPATSTILPMARKHILETCQLLIQCHFDPRVSVELHMDPWAHCHTLASSTDSTKCLRHMQPPLGEHPRCWMQQR
jgi:hypothetical protein